MAFDLTEAARQAKDQLVVDPQLVLEIEGVERRFGASSIKVYIRIGDDGLYIDNYNGEPWYIGGLRSVDGDSPWISFGGGGGTSTKFTQQLDPDKGLGASVTTATVSVIDKDEEVSRIISPGFEKTEILGSNCRIYFAPSKDLAFREDYITVFVGTIEDIASGPGIVHFTLASSESKKRGPIVPPRQCTLAADILDSGAVSNIVVDDNTGFPYRIIGPDGSSVDTSFSPYVKIGDEFFSYGGSIGTTQFSGVVRNASPFAFGQQAHATGDTVELAFRLQGNVVDLARKILMSGWAGYFQTGVPITNFNRISSTLVVSNALFFFGVNVKDLYGLTVGDYVANIGGAQPDNYSVITEIVLTDDGSYLVVDPQGADFVEETDTAATASFRSQWDTLPFGCKMRGQDVDLDEFEKLYRLFLSSFTYDFQLHEIGDGKEWIEKQLLAPIACFTVPRKGKVSVAYHIGPIPGADIVTLDQTNILNADKIKVRRSINKNYFNQVRFDHDKDIVSGKYDLTTLRSDATSQTDFNSRVKEYSIQSDGMRGSQATAISIMAANRLLAQYKRAAEYIQGMQVNLKAGMTIDIGDVLLLDTEALYMTDIFEGNRSGNVRYFRVMNKSFDVAAAMAELELEDTNFSTTARYCLISPASYIRTAASTSEFTIEESFSSIYGDQEFRKWVRYGQIYVRVRSVDGMTRNAVRQIDQLNGNTVLLLSALPFTPQPGDLMEFSHYNDLTDAQKLVYGSMRDTGPFDDGSILYSML